MSSSHIDTDSTLQTIEVMRRQEENGYQVVDYLAQLPACPLETPVDASCRFVMGKWCFDIADFCKYNRETAVIALSCLDRFMATRDGREILLDRDQYQLAAMTALYTAVKIHENEAMDPKLVSTLSRGAHSPEAVEAMEVRMLSAIQWRVNPPTAMAFVRKMLDLVPMDLISAEERETIVELTQFQIDLAVGDYDFAKLNASTIAFSSLLNAVESVSDDGMFFANFETAMAKAIHIDLCAIHDIRIALYEAINGSDPMDMQTIPCCDDAKQVEQYENSQSCIYSSPRAVNA